MTKIAPQTSNVPCSTLIKGIERERPSKWIIRFPTDEIDVYSAIELDIICVMLFFVVVLLSEHMEETFQ